MPKNLPIQEILALDREYDQWIMEACAHEFMRIAHERIANWGGLRAFQHALRSLGEHPCATLLREIPNRNGEVANPADARMCLAELDCFQSTGQLCQIVQLVDGSSGMVIHSRVEPYDGWLGTNGSTHITIRLTEDGMLQIERGQNGCMRHDPGAEILFRSRAFSQAETASGEFRFTDLMSGEQYLHRRGLKDASGSYPASFKVKQSHDTPARYAYCVEPLRRIFQAAIDTDHPVSWR